MFKQLQKLGKAFMLPIAILPAAGLLLGIGGALSNPNTIAAYPFLNVFFLQAIFKIMNAAIGTLLGILNPDGSAIDTGIVGAIAIGVMVTWFHSRFRDIQLPRFLGFFGGSRFIPIVSSFAAIFVGGAFYLIWPPFQSLLVSAGRVISGMGVAGTFLYGFLMRLCGAVGLHHMIYPMFWYTELGGTAVVAGQTVAGAQRIFFAQLADPQFTGVFTEGTRFFAGRFDTMMFGLPGAALAMYHCVSKDRRKLVGGLLLSAALTSAGGSWWQRKY